VLLMVDACRGEMQRHADIRQGGHSEVMLAIAPGMVDV